MSDGKPVSTFPDIAVAPMEALLAGLQASALADAMRNSVFIYPLANVLHVLGALCFFAAVAAMDVRILSHPSLAGTRAFIARVRPVAFAGLAVQLVTGAMLLAPEATHIGHNPAFQAKVAAILLGLLNVALLEILIRRSEIVTAAGRASAAASLAFWLATAAAGRLIAYF
jgi:hypothetical protein